MYGNFYFTNLAMPFVRARFQNIYGPREILGAGSWRGTPATVWRNVIPTFIWRSLKNEPLTLDNGGRSTRDFVFVRDLCRGLVLCALLGKPGEAYNLASGKETTIADLANLIVDKTNSSSIVNLGEKRSWDNSGMRFGDPTKARLELGFECTVSLSDGIEQTVNWTIDNQARISTQISSHDYFMKA
jgi:nucleoside-diphosphate-sugar epimerase